MQLQRGPGMGPVKWFIDRSIHTKFLHEFWNWESHIVLDKLLQERSRTWILTENIVIC